MAGAFDPAKRLGRGIRAVAICERQAATRTGYVPQQHAYRPSLNSALRLFIRTILYSLYSALRVRGVRATKIRSGFCLLLQWPPMREKSQ